MKYIRNTENTYEAMQWTGTNSDEVLQWLLNIDSGILFYIRKMYGCITTYNGRKITINRGEYIVYNNEMCSFFTVDSEYFNKAFSPVEGEKTVWTTEEVEAFVLKGVDEIHYCTDYGNCFGGYNCSCGDPWVDSERGCGERSWWISKFNELK